jgi:hypothetical protein
MPNGASPTFVSVTNFDGLEIPTVWLAKVSAAVDRDALGDGAKETGFLVVL